MLLEVLDDTDDQGRALFKVHKLYRHRIGPGCHVNIPAGWITNLATCPRCCYWLIAPSELHQYAALHDYLVNETFDLGSVVFDSGFSRWMADAILWEGMANLQISYFRRLCVYYAVRLSANFFPKENDR